MRVEKATPDHLKKIDPSIKQPSLNIEQIINNGDEITSWERTYSLIDGDEVLLVGGILDTGGGRAMAWSVMSNGTRGRMKAVSRRVKSFIDYHLKDINRLEVLVNDNFVLGHKWAKLLGFEKESVMRRYAGKEDYAMYVRFGNGPD